MNHIVKLLCIVALTLSLGLLIACEDTPNTPDQPTNQNDQDELIVTGSFTYPITPIIATVGGGVFAPLWTGHTDGQTGDVTYAITMGATDGITIDADTGIIRVAATVGQGMYMLTVTATGTDYEGSQTTELTFSVVSAEDAKILTYKPHDSEHSTKFSIGDYDNPYLFQVVNEAVLGFDVAASKISIAGVDYAIKRTERDTTPDTTPDTTLDTYIGVSGLTYETWKALADNAEIEISVTLIVNEISFIRTITGASKTPVTEIYTWRDLHNISKNANTDNSLLRNSYTLQNDISFPASGDSERVSFDPIGDEIRPFRGSFDGKGKTITGLYINDADLNYAGLFGKIHANAKTTVVVQNLVIADPEISANAMVGTLVGYLSRGTVNKVGVRRTDTNISTNVKSDGAVVDVNVFDFEYGYTGGLLGIVGELGTVVGYATVFVSAKNQYVGGLVGYNKGETTGYATGSVSGVANSVGGLVGLNGGLVSGYATGSVSGEASNVGGLVGGNTANITGYAIGMVKGRYAAGGLVGSNSGGKVIGYARGAVTRAKGTDESIGRVVGRKFGGTIIGFHSVAESLLYDSDGATMLDVTTGEQGLAIDLTTASPENTIVQSSFEATDNALTFGTAVGEWTWLAANTWPAINLGALEELAGTQASATDQATAPSP